MFSVRNFTKSPVNQTQGKKLSSDSMKGRVYEINFGDLTPGQTPSKKIKLIVDEADGASKVATTNFYGMDTTRDSLCGLIKKWHSLIEVQCECKTSDGFLVSEEDFKLRGSGDLFGIRQSGDMQFKIADLKKDFKILLQCKIDTEEFINNNIENNFVNYPHYQSILTELMNND